MVVEVHPVVKCSGLVMVVSNQVDLKQTHSFFVYHQMKIEVFLESLAERRRMGSLFLSYPHAPVLWVKIPTSLFSLH